MVAILEKIRLETKERFVNVDNPFGEKSRDYIGDNTFIFEKGKIYGIICEHGGGGEAISLLLSNQIPKEEEKIYFDDVLVGEQDTQQMGWYMGKPIYSNMPIRREVSIKKALNHAINKYHRYENINDVIEDFALTPGILNYGLSRNCNWEKWRASLAIGYASKKNDLLFSMDEYIGIL